MIITFCYHEISANSKSRWAITPDELSKQIRVLKEYKFQFLTLNNIPKNASFFNQKYCILTFDDGRLGACSKGAEILEEYGIKAVYYICANFIDRILIPENENYTNFCSWSGLKELSRVGHVIASHSLSHRRLSEISQDECYLEMLNSKIRIEKEIGQSCEHFATPYGEINQNLINLSKEVGYKSIANIEEKKCLKQFTFYPVSRFDIIAEHDFEKVLNRLIKNQ